MDPFEKAIRGAFEKSDPSDLSVRRRVYRSALAALDRAIAANPSVTEPQAATRRGKLKKLIANIESEFSLAADQPIQNKVDDVTASRLSVAEDAHTSMTNQAVAPNVGGAEPRLHSQSTGKRKSAFGASPRQEPSFQDIPTADFKGAATSAPEMSEEVAPGIAARIRTNKLRHEGKKSRWPKFILNLIIFLLIVAACIYGAWWVMNVDLKQFSTTDTQDQNLDFTSRTVGGAHDQNWIEIFNPRDLSTVQALNGAAANLSNDGRNSYLEIISPSDTSTTRFDVGLGTMQNFMGKKSIILVSAKSASNEPTDIAVSCNFGALGSCARKRFTVSGDVKDFLFEYDFPNRSPDATGSIDIISDIDGGGKAVKIVKILIRDAAEN